jgi:DNA-binding NarL/FixJ family response regulator
VAQLAEHLVGRAGELGAIDDALDAVERGGAAAVELVGEPGIGKTRLLAELARRADRRGWLVLTGAASELERALPFWIFVDALDDYVRSQRLDASIRSRLAHMLPGLDGDGAAAPEPYLTHVALRDLLESLAAEQPLVLALDDLHWADPGSVEQLAGLLRRPPAAPLLLALAVRPRQTPERLVAALGRAAAEGRLTRCELTGLTRDQARELVGARADDVYDESGGNPFYLEQLARGLQRDVAGALAEELGQLGERARLVLQGAAVAGDPFEPELAGAAADVSDADALDALDELLRLDLARPTDVPRRFRFRHPLVRRAVYESAPAGWRLRAHERCAAALAARGAGPAARAQHLERCAQHGDAAAIAVLREAAAAVATTAPATACDWLGAALRLLPDIAPGRGELLLARAQALAAAGRLADARDDLLACLELAPRQVELVIGCANVEHLLGRHEDAHARLAAALPDQDPENAFALMVALALDDFYRSAFDSAWPERALHTARVLEQPGKIAAALAMRAIMSASSTSPLAEAHTASARAAIEALPEQELLEPLAGVALAELYLGELEPAEAHSDRALALAATTAQRQRYPYLAAVLATAKRYAGDLAGSAAVLDAAIEIERLNGNQHALAFNLVNRIHTCLYLGDVDGALAAGREVLDVSQGLDRSVVDAWIGGIFGEALLASGDAERAVESILNGGGGERVPRLPATSRVFALDVLARAQIALGRLDDAARSAALAADVAGSRRFTGALARRTAAAVALASGSKETAAEQARASAAGFDALGARVDAALARLVAGRALDDRDAAIAELERAAAAFDHCGAARWRDEAERELRALGRRVYRRSAPGTGEGLDSLTERELEVARLVVDRCTNTQIAAELFLSKKTVETHLRNIFAKLGVSSRVELARAVEERDGGR